MSQWYLQRPYREGTAQKGEHGQWLVLWRLRFILVVAGRSNYLALRSAYYISKLKSFYSSSEESTHLHTAYDMGTAAVLSTLKQIELEEETHAIRAIVLRRDSSQSLSMELALNPPRVEGLHQCSLALFVGTRCVYAHMTLTIDQN